MTDGRYLGNPSVQRLAQVFTTNQTLTVDSTPVAIFDCTSGNLTCTLPAASAAVGKIFYIVKSDTSLNILTISGTIDAATHTLEETYNSRMIYSDGTSWRALGGREFYFDASGNRFAFGHRNVSFTINGAAFNTRASFDTDTATTTLGIAIDRHSSVLPCWIWGFRTRGTEAAPTVVSNGDYILQIAAAGYDGTDYEQCGSISFEIDGTPGNNDMPGRIVFYTTPDGSNAVAEAMRINKEQRVIIGNGNETYGFQTNVNQKLNVNAQITDIDQVISILAGVGLNVNPSANVSTGANGIAIYAALGSTANVEGTETFTGIPLGPADVTTSVLGFYGGVNDRKTSGTLDGAVGCFYEANHEGYGSTANDLVAATFGANTNDAAEGGSPTGTVGNLRAVLAGCKITAVVPSTARSGHFIEPFAEDAGYGAGTPSIANMSKAAIHCDGTLAIREQEVESASSITALDVIGSVIYLTGVIATTIYGMKPYGYNKMVWVINLTGAALTIAHQSGTEGTAANRIICPTGANMATAANGSFQMYYSSNQSRWVVLNQQG